MKKLAETYDIYLFGEINSELAKNLILGLKIANQDETYKDILITIFSGGGSLTSAFAISDYIKLSKKPVNCIATGWCGSSGVAILQCGQKRFCTESTRFMLHPSSYSFEDYPYQQAKRFIEHADFMQDKFVELTTAKAGITKDEFNNLCNPAFYLSAQEALEFGKNGLVDKII